MRTGRRRPPILTVALGVLTVAAIIVAVAVVGTPSTSSARERTVTVRRGVVESTVSGSGNLAAKKQVNLDFALSGKVTHIYVHEGEKVVKGELLATIDPSSAKVAVAQAQADLQSAEDTLSSVSSSSSTTTAATASASTTQTIAYVAQTSPSTTPTTTTPTTTTPSTKKNSAPSSSSKQSTTQPAASSSSANQSAPSSSSGTGSSGSGTKTSHAAALAAVESAELSVKSAQAELRGTKIIAPAAATVAEVNGSVGETAGSSSSNTAASAQGSTGSTGSSSFIVLAQLQSYKMDVSLTESDIGKVRVGQPATVTVNAASGAEFSAHVASVGVLPSSSSSSTSSSSAVSYPVTLVLDQAGAGIKPGMSASADIITSRASGIVVPTEALNGSTVTVVRNGKQTPQQVQTGVAGDTTTQILAGLRAGDQIVIKAATVNASAGGTGNTGLGSRTGRFGGGLGGGGIGGGGFAVPGGGNGPPGGFPR